MFEVVYISPTTKNAVKFINDTEDRLKNLGIEDFKLDKRNLRIETEKYIISVISLSGSMIGRSYGKAKYYIDGVTSYWGYDTAEIFEKACTKLKDIKSRFKRGTKEISIFELVDILSEVD